MELMEIDQKRSGTIEGQNDRYAAERCRGRIETRQLLDRYEMERLIGGGFCTGRPNRGGAL